MKKYEVELTDDIVDKILSDGIQCCAQVEVGEIVDCLMTLFRGIQDSAMMQNIKRKLNKEYHEDIDKLMICFFVSEIATITKNFKDREEEGVEA